MVASRGRRRRARWALAVLAAIAPGLAGCSADGPDDVQDGRYVLYASSAGSADGETAELTIDGDAVRVTTSSGTTEATLGEPTDPAELCPGGGRGRPIRLEAEITAGAVTLGGAAIYGDCGATSPVRVTVVDLGSRSDELPPFSRWVEFCLASDPDCPSG